MNQWEEISRKGPPHIWYPSHPYPGNSSFLEVKQEALATPRPLQIPEHKVTERDIATANIWPLLPAVVGAGTSFSLLLMLNHKRWGSKEAESQSGEECSVTRDTPVGSAVLVLYSLLATAGVSYYVYSVLSAADGTIISAFIPVASAIIILILYFAAAYSLEDHMNPGSFSVENIGDDIVSRLNTFVYFSITTFATAGGDMSPITNTARMLVSIEVFFIIFIFTMGFVFFVSDPKE